MKPLLVLLVESDALVSMDLEAFLADDGFEVAHASTGTEAIAELRADPSRFHAVLTATKVGSGPSGWDVARFAREVVPYIPVVYISGIGASQWSMHGVPDSIMIAKPYVRAQVSAALASVMKAGARLATEPADDARGDVS